MKKRSEAAPLSEELQTEETQKEHGSGRGLTIYAVLLVLVVVLCIVLSYLIQNRNGRVIDTLNEQNLSAQQKIENLQDTNVALTEENSDLKTENQSLRDEIAGLEASIADIRSQWDAEVQAVREKEEDKYNDLWKLYKDLVAEAAELREQVAGKTAEETENNGGDSHA